MPKTTCHTVGILPELRPLAVLLAMAAALASSTTAGASDAAAARSDEDDLKPAAITVSADRSAIGIDGDFAEGTARRLRVLLRGYPSIRIIDMTSEGGLVDEAEQVGDIVAAHNLSTVVRGHCASACTLAFVRGHERLVQSGAKLGFHAPFVSADGGGEEEVASDDERQAYVAAGIAPDFVSEALAVPASSIWFPEEGRLLAARVVTAILPADGLAARLAKIAEPTRLAAAE